MLVDTDRPEPWPGSGTVRRPCRPGTPRTVMRRSAGLLECPGEELGGADECGARVVLPVRGEWFEPGRQRVPPAQVGNLLHGCLRVPAPPGDSRPVHPPVRGGGLRRG